MVWWRAMMAENGGMNGVGMEHGAPPRKEGDVREVFSITPMRTFGDIYGAIAQLWLFTRSGYLGMLLMAGVMAGVFSLSSPWWVAIVGALAWTAVIWPCMLALQSWKTLRHWKREGPSTFTFDAEGVHCRARHVETRVLWTGMVRVKLTKRRCFLYFTPRLAWFLRRADLGPEGEAAVLAFAAEAGVQVDGGR